MSMGHDDFMLAQGRIADLEAENARLQEQVHDLEESMEESMTATGLSLGKDKRDLKRKLRKVQGERDGWEAQSKVRGEALGRISRQADATIALLFRVVSTAETRREKAFDLHSGLKDISDTARDAIAMTPEDLSSPGEKRDGMGRLASEGEAADRRSRALSSPGESECSTCKGTRVAPVADEDLGGKGVTLSSCPGCVERE